MIGEPLNSPYDLQFRLFDYHVRVTWLFWIIAAAFGYSISMATDEIYAARGGETPGAFMLLIIWIAAMFLSILIHEFGHALAMRYYNIESRIVLYHFGGLAIPSAFRRMDRRAPGKNGYGPQAQLLISLAGPVAQLGFAVLVMSIALALKYDFYFSSWIVPLLGIDEKELQTPTNAAVYAAINFSIYPSVAWALLNLLPVLPLDGGRIAQHGLTIYQKQDALYEATVLSCVVAALVALWGFNNGDQFLGIMFMMLGFSNFQNLRGGISGF